MIGLPLIQDGLNHKLNLYIDGKLNAQEAATLEAHIESLPEEQAFEYKERMMRNLIRDKIERKSAPEHLAQRIKAQVQVSKQQQAH